jgi:hypothetical protein
MFVGKAGAIVGPGTPEPGRYGEVPNENALVPWFEAGPDLANILHQDTLIVVINLQNATPVTSLDFTFWSVNSQKSFNVCRPVTPADVEPLSVFDAIKASPPAANTAILGGCKAGTGVCRGYVTVETFQDTNCAGAPIPAGILAFVYQVQLQQGNASGFLAPTFAGSPDVGGNFEEFAVDPDEAMVFRILNGLGGDDASAQTTVWVWSATSGNCGAFPDSCCLEADREFLVCDEDEGCFSLVPPLLCGEVNFFNADFFLPVGSGLNGWFVLHNDTQNPLYVLGYSDNKANGLGALLNWQAIFPAPLTAGNPLPSP